MAQTTWKYLYITLPPNPYQIVRDGQKTDETRNATDVMNEWGQDGWECFHVESVNGLPYAAFFKKPVQSSPVVASLSSVGATQIKESV